MVDGERQPTRRNQTNSPLVFSFLEHDFVGRSTLSHRRGPVPKLGNGISGNPILFPIISEVGPLILLSHAGNCNLDHVRCQDLESARNCLFISGFVDSLRLTRIFSFFRTVYAPWKNRINLHAWVHGNFIFAVRHVSEESMTRLNLCTFVQHKNHVHSPSCPAKGKCW
jgi:hypothetical protein